MPPLPNITSVNPRVIKQEKKMFQHWKIYRNFYRSIILRNPLIPTKTDEWAKQMCKLQYQYFNTSYISI